MRKHKYTPFLYQDKIRFYQLKSKAKNITLTAFAPCPSNGTSVVTMSRHCVTLPGTVTVYATLVTTIFSIIAWLTF